MYGWTDGVPGGTKCMDRWGSRGNKMNGQTGFQGQ